MMEPKLALCPDLVKLVAEIDEFKGRWEALKTLSPDRLYALRKVATIESVGSSTRIEAGQARTSLSDFIRRKALEAAEMDMLERSSVTIPAKDWEAFEAWADRPAERTTALEELARSEPAWRK